MSLFGYEIGTFAFFVFSFVAAAFIFLQAIFGCREETSIHRTVRGSLGLIYFAVTTAAFLQIEVIGSPYQLQ